MNKQVIPINSTEFSAKNEYVLVKPTELETEKVTDGGIILQINRNPGANRPTLGTIVSYGGDMQDIKAGDTVIWPETDGIDMEFDDGHFVLLRYKSIIGLKK